MAYTSPSDASGSPSAGPITMKPTGLPVPSSTTYRRWRGRGAVSKDCRHMSARSSAESESRYSSGINPFRYAACQARRWTAPKSGASRRSGCLTRYATAPTYWRASRHSSQTELRSSDPDVEDPFLDVSYIPRSTYPHRRTPQMRERDRLQHNHGRPDGPLPAPLSRK